MMNNQFNGGGIGGGMGNPSNFIGDPNVINFYKNFIIVQPI